MQTVTFQIDVEDSVDVALLKRQVREFIAWQLLKQQRANRSRAAIIMIGIIHTLDLGRHKPFTFDGLAALIALQHAIIPDELTLALALDRLLKSGVVQRLDDATWQLTE
jgi:hypothetical protein